MKALGPCSIERALAPSLSSAHEGEDGKDVAVIEGGLKALKGLDAGAVFHDDDMGLELIAVKYFGVPFPGIAKSGQRVPDGSPGFKRHLFFFSGKELTEISEKLDLNGHGS